LGKRFDIQGFPTIKFFPKGQADAPVDYSGGRDLDSLTTYMREETGQYPRVQHEASFVQVVTDDNFSKIVDGSKNVLLEIYAPWCGHCKQLAPTYEQIAKDFRTEKNVVIAKLDGTENNKIPQQYDVKGYPTLLFFAQGQPVNEPIPYDGSRSHDDLMAFTNSHSGTLREIGGGLSAEAGRIADLDVLVSAFIKVQAPEEREAAFQKIGEFNLAEVPAHGKYYVKAASKTFKDPSYPQKELNRLEKILLKGSVTPERVDEFTTRTNILKAFLLAEELEKDPDFDEL